MRKLCIHIETSSLWAVFVNKNRCISVSFVSKEDKPFYFDNSHNNFLWPEYFIDFLCERWIPCQASTSVLCLHYRPETVHCSTKDAYTSEITFLALQPWLFQRYTHFLYCSVLSLGCKVNTRQMSQPEMGSIFHSKKSMKYSGHKKLLCELSK